MEKHTPLRKCVACSGHFPKSEMIKVIKNNDGFFIDFEQKKEGRGAYVCKAKSCINTAILKKQFNRSFKTAVSPELYFELEKILKHSEASDE